MCSSTLFKSVEYFFSPHSTGNLTPRRSVSSPLVRARRAAELRAEGAVPEMHERQTPVDDRAGGDSTPERFDAAHRKLKRSRDARKPLFLIVAQRLGVEDVEPRAAVQRESPGGV